MNVKVIVRDDLSEGSGSTDTKIPIKEGETIDTLLIKLSKRNPKIVESILNPRTGDLKDKYNIELNGRSIKKIKGLHTRLKNKDEVAISVQNTH